MSYIVGIDLGTTNCSLAYQREGEDSIHQLPIYQRVEQDHHEERFTLPSFYLFPPGEEPSVGFFAKLRGEELPERVVTSAKSWLSCASQDLHQPFLPLNHEEKISPVGVLSAFLTHLKRGWEEKMPPLIDQRVFITVPASFDPDARALVQESAQQAGYPEVVLIEEPLAAFYAWLHKMKKSWRDLIHLGESVLVIDIGGGTTDFTLIRVEESDGELALKREAVGQHLLLGGDNLDLAFAHFVQAKMSRPASLGALVHSCRAAKEELLSGMKETMITVLGQGSGVIGSASRTQVNQTELYELLVDGFFPTVPLDCSCASTRRSALGQQGLPFARDPRFSAHLAAFCREHALPSAILLNGGTLKAEPFQKRLQDQLSLWKGEEVRVLPDPDFDFAVACGAVAFGSNNGIRVRAPSPRSFWVGIEGSAPAIPGVPPPMQALCLIPRGLEEGSETTLQEEFTLQLGEPTLFRFFSASTGESGDSKDDLDELQELTPIETSIAEEKETALVHLRGRLTELGMLELWCEANDGRRWMLEFNARQDKQEPVFSSPSASSLSH